MPHSCIYVYDTIWKIAHSTFKAINSCLCSFSILLLARAYESELYWTNVVAKLLLLLVPLLLIKIWHEDTIGDMKPQLQQIKNQQEKSKETPNTFNKHCFIRKKKIAKRLAPPDLYCTEDSFLRLNKCWQKSYQRTIRNKNELSKTFNYIVLHQMRLLIEKFPLHLFFIEKRKGFHAFD